VVQGLKGTTVQERRRLPRHAVLKSAKIVFNHQSSLIDCTVCNLTSDGACLLFATKIPAAESIKLSFDNFRSIRTCRVAWQKIDSLGVCFCDVRVASDLPSTPDIRLMVRHGRNVPNADIAPVIRKTIEAAN
jgi:PilZ domain